MNKPVPYPKASRFRLCCLCEVVEDACTALYSFLLGLDRSRLPESTRRRWARIVTRAYRRNKYVAQSIRERIGDIQFEKLAIDDPPCGDAWLEWASQIVACGAGAMVAAVPMEDDYPDDEAHKRAFASYMRVLASISSIFDELTTIITAIRPSSGYIN